MKYVFSRVLELVDDFADWYEWNWLKSLIERVPESWCDQCD